MTKDEVFQLIIDTISKYGAKWWLDAGTCLAVVRKNDFILPTDDVDIGIHEKDVHLWYKIIDDFKALGFKHAKSRAYKGYQVTIGFTGPEKLDIFFYYRKGAYLWHPVHGKATPDTKYKVFKPEKFSKRLFDNLKEVTFKDRLCYLPNPPEKYLVERYGKEWREPNPEYKFWRDSKAIDMEFV